MRLTDFAVVRPDELDAGFLTAWRRLQQGSAHLGNPFLSPDFTIAVGRARPRVRVAIGRADDGEPIAFLPFERGPLGAGRPVGYGISDQQCVVAHPGTLWNAHQLLAGCGLHTLLLENYPSDRLPVDVDHRVEYPSPVIDLRDGYPAYLASRRAVSRSFVQTAERKRRKLEREVGELRFDFCSTSAEALRTVMRWKSQQYARLAEWDRFADNRIVGIVHELFATGTPECSGTLSVLYAGDRIAAAHFGVRSRTVLCSWFPAYDPELARYSPGILLHLSIAEAAAERQVHTFDLGRGEHSYKDVLKSRELMLARGRLFAPGLPGLAHRLAVAPRHHVRPFVKRHPKLERVLVRGARLLTVRPQPATGRSGVAPG